MDKVDALVILRDAFWHTDDCDQAGCDAAKLLEEAFHKVRRSIQNVVWDTNHIHPYLPNKVEGWNPKGPQYF